MILFHGAPVLHGHFDVNMKVAVVLLCINGHTGVGGALETQAGMKLLQERNISAPCNLQQEVALSTEML